MLVVRVVHGGTVPESVHSTLEHCHIQVFDHKGEVLLAESFVRLRKVGRPSECLLFWRLEEMVMAWALDLYGLATLLEYRYGQDGPDLTEELACVCRA